MVEKIEFTKYAEFQLEERLINRLDVLDTIKYPGQIVIGHKGRKIAQKILQKSGEDGLLRVIFEEKEGILLVITVYWTSKLRKYWS